MLFEADFLLGEDLEDPGVLDRPASVSGIELAPLHAALADGNAAVAPERRHSVQGTPAWLVNQELMGLRPAAEVERLAETSSTAQ